MPKTPLLGSLPPARHAVGVAAAALEQGEPVLILDTGRRILLANRGFEELIGIRREQLLGHIAWHVLSNTDGFADACRQASEQAAVDTAPVVVEHYHAPRQCRLSIAAYPTSEGVALYCRPLPTSGPDDPAERLGFDSATCVSVLAHDLRTPLRSILICADLLRRGETAELETLCAQIGASGERMGRLIELLDVTRLRVGGALPLRRQTSDLAALCCAAIDEVSMGSAPEQPVSLQVKGNCKGRWDPDRLAQVVSNLVSNAVHHGEPATPVTVSLDGTRGTAVTLTVANQGVIPPQLMPVLFEAFAGLATREGRSGLGLGLFITREIVRCHGGSVEVESDAAGGTRFRVHLPRQ